MHVDFLHDGMSFTGETLRNASLGGTESSVVLLAEALSRRGHKVTVYNNVQTDAEHEGVLYRSVNAKNGNGTDIGIAVASPKLFAGTHYRLPILWLHNPTNYLKQIKRGNFFPLYRAKPVAVLLGNYHDESVSRGLPFRARTIIHHGVDPAFFRSSPTAAPPRRRAIFTSQPYRGLDMILELWPEVMKQVPDAELHVFAPKEHQANRHLQHKGVSFRGSVPRSVLATELLEARVQLIPGHRDETYCLAAAEALASGVPVITLGTGALRERVTHNKTGFVASTKEAFLAQIVALLMDDRLWNLMHNECIQERNLMTWDKRSESWDTLFNGYLGS